MKKLLLATLVAGLATTASADILKDGHVFVQADLGSMKLHFDDEDGSDDLKKSNFTQRIAVGYEVEQTRIALDYTNFGKVKGSESFTEAGLDVDVKGKIKVQGFGVTLAHTFEVSDLLNPYVGARIGWTTGKAKVDVTVQEETYTVSDSKTRFSAGLLAGVESKVTDNVTLGLGAEYHRLASDAKSYGANAFLRVSF